MKQKILTLFTLSLSILFSSNVFAVEKVIATVNGIAILSGQVNAALGNNKNTPANRKKALNNLIDDILIQRVIREADIAVTDADVDRAIQSVADQNGITWGQLLDALDYQGIDYYNYRRQLYEQILMGQVSQFVISKNLKIDREKILSLAKEMQQKAKKKGKLHKVTGKEYRVSHILLTTNPILTDKKAQDELSQIRANILFQNTTFTKAAKTYSKDYLSGYHGGDLGFAFPETYAPEFAEKIRSTPRGIISEPFKTQFGWHILKVTDIRKADQTEQYYQQKAYEKLVNEQAQMLSKNWKKILRDNANIQIIE